jgi:beta-glucuronidase
MNRRFSEHDIRFVTDLSGFWDFAFLGDVDPDAVDVSAITFDDTMAVPGCFDATPKYAGRRGLVAYRTRVAFEDTTLYRLILDGVHHWCRVFLEGESVGDHVGGYTRFAMDLHPSSTEPVDLVILVDNRFDYDRCPLHLEYFDWYHYGGIARSAELHRLGKLWIDDLQVVTTSIMPPEIRLSVRYGTTTPSSDVSLSVSVDDVVMISEEITTAENSGLIERTLKLPDADLWSPDDPNLHNVRVVLGDDDRRERIGIRQVRVEGQEILINGEPVQLLGFNRHEAHPQFGPSVPPLVMSSDIQQLKDMNCNFVRGSHYPQDTRFLDLCDEAGICVWSESIGWQHTAEHLTDPHFIDAELRNIDEMVAASFNHPSVIMWGILNESHSHDPECRPGYSTLLGRLRDLDPTRPITYASNHPFEDVCLDLVDVVSINNYPGWYGGEIEDIPEQLDGIVEHLDSHGQADKPLIISEIGAGAVPGWRDWNEARWSEPYQAKLLDTVIRHLFVDRDRVMGLALWQFCDCRTSEAVRKILGRPRGFNNKGIVDEYRRPKQGYGVVKAHFGELEEA